MAGQHGFDLVELDPEAANFDLVIDSPETLKVSVLELAGEIARAVQRQARFRMKAIGDKALRVKSGRLR